MIDIARNYGRATARRAWAVNHNATPDICAHWNAHTRALWLELAQADAFEDAQRTRLKPEYRAAFIEGLHEEAAKEWQE